MWLAVGAEGADPEAWLPARVTSLLAQRLELLGVRGLDRRLAIDAADLPAISGSVTPESTDSAEARVNVRLSLAVPGRDPLPLVAEGPAHGLDRLASGLALKIAARLGAPPPEAEALLQDFELPFPVHRLLGRAELRAARGDHRQAAMMFDRAGSFSKEVVVPEALLGRRRAEGAMVALGQASLGARTELAVAAREHAEAALKAGHTEEARRAFESALRHAEAQALAWTLETPAGPDAQILERGDQWVVQLAGARLTLDARTGAVRGREAPLPGLVAATADALFTLEGRTLSRREAGPKARWAVNLPFAPRARGAAGVELTSGLLGVLGEEGVAWVEVSFGQLGQVAKGVEPLASGAGGVVVMAPPKKGASGAPEVALLRPGKRTPAWRFALERPRQTVLTRDRVVMVAPPGLVLLRSFDGKPIRPPIPLAPGALILGAEGRYASVAFDDGTVGLFDILAGEQTATVRGPGAPVASETTAEGVALLYEEGDLVFYNRDGRALDRARAHGRPLRLLRGHPMTPGPVVLSSAGLFALGEVSAEAPRRRDVDAMLDLARLFASAQPRAALVLATEVARRSAGRVADAERLRAELYARRDDPASQAAARWARARAAAAEGPTRPLPSFQLAGRAED